MVRYKRQPRGNRKDNPNYMGNISVTLPIECIVMIDRYKKECGDNRSLALEYIIRDWSSSRRVKE